MKTTAELVDEYLAKYPPSSFALHEIRGAMHPILTPPPAPSPARVPSGPPPLQHRSPHDH